MRTPTREDRLADCETARRVLTEEIARIDAGILLRPRGPDSGKATAAWLGELHTRLDEIASMILELKSRAPHA